MLEKYFLQSQECRSNNSEDFYALSHLVLWGVGVYDILIPQLHQTHYVGGAVEVHEAST